MPPLFLGSRRELLGNREGLRGWKKEDFHHKDEDTNSLWLLLFCVLRVKILQKTVGGFVAFLIFYLDYQDYSDY